MVWLSIASLVLAVAALVVALVLWRRLARMEKNKTLVDKPPYTHERAPYDSMELTLGAMLEELEAKNQEIVSALDRRLEQFASKDAFVPPRPDPTTGHAISQHKFDAVHRLASEGHDVLAIAQQLGLGKGEVRLILDLKRPRS